jgi:sugar phosphate permease
VTNPISGWIVSHYSWRGLFFFEGVVSLALIFVWLPLISDRPEEAKWISKEEREYLQATLAAEKAAQQAKTKETAQTKWIYLQLFNDKNLWLMILIYLCYNTGSWGYVIWLPTLLKKMTKMSLTNVGWLSALPLAAAVLGVYTFGALCDRKGNRRGYTALSLFAFGFCFWLSTLFPSHIWLSYGVLCVTGFLSKALQSPFWSMPAVVFPPGLAGGARGVVNGIGALGGFVGPVLVGWFSTRTGNMTNGIYSVIVASLIGGVIAMLMPKVTAGYKYLETTKPGEAKAAGK